MTGLLLSETIGQWQSTSACREQKSGADADGKGQVAASACPAPLPVVDGSSSTCRVNSRSFVFTVGDKSVPVACLTKLAPGPDLTPTVFCVHAQKPQPSSDHLTHVITGFQHYVNRQPITMRNAQIRETRCALSVSTVLFPVATATPSQRWCARSLRRDWIALGPARREPNLMRSHP